MHRQSRFSYLCQQCGRCCHNQVITLSPYDVFRLARAAGLSTAETVARYTIRRGSILKFKEDGSCTALEGAICTLHSGRPLACRIYPLGVERDDQGGERYLRLDPAAGSEGIYGTDGTVQDFLGTQDAETYMQVNRRYAGLLRIFHQRIAVLIDFDLIEPREFWRVAVREALAETDFDFNPIIEALFDADGLGCRDDSATNVVEHHLIEIEQRIRNEQDPAILAVAAVMLAVSLGYSPGQVMTGYASSPTCSE
jgi:Fe-S-cluster containining protein